MRVVKYTHACVRLESGDRALVIDPGAFSEEEPLDGAEAVLITHEHVDHLDPAKLARHPELRIWTNAAVAALLTDFDPDRIEVVADGSSFAAAGFDIEVYGERHEVIHPDLPDVPNIGFLVNGSFFHPGDAFTVLDRPVQTLMVPISAPWLRGRDSIDYIRAVQPGLALAAHDGMLNDIGMQVQSGLVARMSEAVGIAYQRLDPGTAVDLT